MYIYKFIYNIYIYIYNIYIYIYYIYICIYIFMIYKFKRFKRIYTNSTY